MGHNRKCAVMWYKASSYMPLFITRLYLCEEGGGLTDYNKHLCKIMTASKHKMVI